MAPRTGVQAGAARVLPTEPAVIAGGIVTPVPELCDWRGRGLIA